jgi:hypothetical protein
MPVLDWDYLAQTPQGQAATAIYNQSLTVQGPHGPLATQARRRTARSPGAMETAYWSTDGGIGVISNGEPEGPQWARGQPSLEQFRTALPSARSGNTPEVLAVSRNGRLGRRPDWGIDSPRSAGVHKGYRVRLFSGGWRGNGREGIQSTFGTGASLGGSHVA